MYFKDIQYPYYLNLLSDRSLLPWVVMFSSALHDGIQTPFKSFASFQANKYRYLTVFLQRVIESQ